MRDQLSKMTLRQLGLWLMVMLDPAYKALYADRLRIPTEYEYPKSVKCLLEKSIAVFENILDANCTQLQDPIGEVLDAAHHITAIPSGQAWVGRAVYSVMLGLEVLIDELVTDVSPINDIHCKQVQMGLGDFEVAFSDVLKSEPSAGYCDRLNYLGSILNKMEEISESDPFGKPLPAEFVENTLKDTFFDKKWKQSMK